MGDVPGPGRLVLGVLRLQRDAVSGPRSLPHPDFELQPLAAHALGQAHLAGLRAGEDDT